MSDPQSAPNEPSEQHQSRLQLVWDVVIFQFKLAADGLRDVLLSPVSIVAGLVGLLAGGDEPDRYFRQVLRFGRRTEIWLNLFGRRRFGKTSDDLVDPIREHVFNEAQKNPWISKAGTGINRTLDSVNASIAAKSGKKTDD